MVKLGALFFIIELPTQYAIQLQLLGGILIIQTLPAVLLGLYTRRLNPWALLIGWAAGIGARHLDGVDAIALQGVDLSAAHSSA